MCIPTPLTGLFGIGDPAVKNQQHPLITLAHVNWATLTDQKPIFKNPASPLH